MICKVFLSIALFAIAVYSMPVDPEPASVPQPYKFGYKIKDKHGEQYREEESDGKNVVKGSYGYVDDKGIKRQVDYIADHAGFRAKVQTNEPGTANQNPASVLMISNANNNAGDELNEDLGNAALIIGSGLGNGANGNNDNGPNDNSGNGRGNSFAMVDGLRNEGLAVVNELGNEGLIIVNGNSVLASGNGRYHRHGHRQGGNVRGNAYRNYRNGRYGRGNAQNDYRRGRYGHGNRGLVSDGLSQS